jgi:uncharacterized damage-inducible protein DinB
MRQVWEGEDFPSAKSILRNVTSETAAVLPPGFKYSLLTLVEHADLWQRIWLSKLLNEPRPDFRDDWRVPDPEEWPLIRRNFLERFEQALRFAAETPRAKDSKREATINKLLTQIAVHNAYHIGQFVLLKRAARAWSKQQA